MPLFVFSAIFILPLFFVSGCGVVGILGTPTPSEKSIPAEFKLAERKGDKILVLVNQPAWLGAPIVLRQLLTEQITALLNEKAKIGSADIISYQELSDFRSKEPGYYMLSENQVAGKLNADLLLFVMLDDYSMLNLDNSGVFTGSLGGKAVLIDIVEDKQLWPAQDTKIISVGFDSEGRGLEMVIQRLAVSFSHCLTRYLYDCPYRKFKTADDKGGLGWTDWED